MKEEKERYYKAREILDVIHSLLEFTIGLGLKLIAQYEVVDKILDQSQMAGDTESKSYINRQKQSMSDSSDRRQRCSILYIYAYKQGKTEFFLPKLLVDRAENSDEILSISFIQKDFINVFFRPTIDFRERLLDPPSEDTSRRLDRDDVSGDSSPSEDNSSLLEETLDIELTSSIMSTP